MKTVLFYQHFGLKGVVRGAHHKTFDFFHHIKSFKNYIPLIFFDETSIWDENLPWFKCFDIMPTLKDLKVKPDILFLNSGKDWIKYMEHLSIPDDIPIVSPVNNFRAVSPKHKSFQLLTRKAIRLCPSQELYEAVDGHPNTNGLTVYLPNGVGIDDEAQKIKLNKKIDLLIVGNKNPELARKVYAKINHMNLEVDMIDNWVSKKEFQHRLANSRISVHLPKIVEEHYIPGVEAMMLESLVIIPDCVGNRSYSKNLETCIIAKYNLDGVLSAIKNTLLMDKNQKKIILHNAIRASKVFLLREEREMILKMLNITNKMW